MLSEKKDIGKLKKSEKEHSNNTTAYGTQGRARSMAAE